MRNNVKGHFNEHLDWACLYEGPKDKSGKPSFCHCGMTDVKYLKPERKRKSGAPCFCQATPHGSGVIDWKMTIAAGSIKDAGGMALPKSKDFHRAPPKDTLGKKYKQHGDVLEQHSPKRGGNS